MTSRLVCRVIFIVLVGSLTAIFSLASKQPVICSLGRTGRAGREGKAVTYFTDEDAPFLKTFVVDYISFLSFQLNTILPLALPMSCYNPGHQFQIGYSNCRNHPK
jgi:hypothetical protein